MDLEAASSEEENWFEVDQRRLEHHHAEEEENWLELDQRNLSLQGDLEEEDWLATEFPSSSLATRSSAIVVLPARGNAADSSTALVESSVPVAWQGSKQRVSAVHMLAHRLLVHASAARPFSKARLTANPMQTQMGLAKDCDLSHTAVSRYILQIAEGVFASSLQPSVFAQSALAWSRRDGSHRITVLVSARAKKWDSTKIGRLKSRIKASDADKEPGAKNAGIVNGPQEISVMTCRFAMVIRKRALQSEGDVTPDQYLILRASAGTHLATHDRNTAENYRAMLSIFDEKDYSLDVAIPRSLEFNIVDEFSANVRYHKACKRDRPLCHHLLRICLCHKKANVSGHVFSASGGFISRLTRFGLSLERNVHSDLLESARNLVNSPKLVILLHGHNTTDADNYREHVYNLFLSQDTPFERWRSSIIRSLFNGDIRRTDRIEHVERGCCKSEADTKKLMSALGVPALFSNFKTIDRKNWTGAFKSIARPGLAFLIHRLLPQAYCEEPVEPQTHDADEAADKSDHEVDQEIEGEVAAGVELPVLMDGIPPDFDDPSHIWKEDLKLKVGGSRRWLSSDVCHDDFLLNAAHQVITEKCVLRQLKVGGINWSRQQEKQYLREGTRSYKSWEAFDSLDLHNAMSQTWLHLTDQSLQQLYSHRSELQQLRLFKVFSRQGGSHYDIICRTRKWEYKFLSAPRFGHVRKSFREALSCVLGTYVDGHRSFWIGADASIPGLLDRPFHPAQEAEIFMTLDLLEEDTTDIERWHSWNDRRAKLRALTHAPSLEAISAQFSCFHSTVHSHNHAVSSKEVCDGSAPERVDNVPGAWGYRAFQVLERKNHYCGSGTEAAMSALWRALDAEARAYYVELGALAQSRWLEGEDAFAPIRWPRKSSQRPRLGGHGVCSVGEDNVIVQQANAEWQRGRRKAESDQVEEATTRSYVSEHSQREMPSVLHDWKLVGGSSPLQESNISCHASAGSYKCLALERHVDGALDAAKHILSQPLPVREAAEESWKQRHTFIRHKEQPSLGKVPSYTNQCYDAERCVHEGEGLRLSLAFSQVHLCFDLAIRLVHRRQHQNEVVKLIKDGELVLRFRWPSPDTEVMLENIPSDMAFREVWMHVSYMLVGKGEQWRPTFLLMERNPAGDRHGCLGVKLNRVSSQRNGRWKNLWEVLHMFVHYETDSLLLQFFRLHADNRRVIIQPWLQRVQALPDVPEFMVFKVEKPKRKTAEKSKVDRRVTRKDVSARRVRARGRGGRPRGRRGGFMNTITLNSYQ